MPLWIVMFLCFYLALTSRISRCDLLSMTPTVQGKQRLHPLVRLELLLLVCLILDLCSSWCIAWFDAL
jgi:hypothetical protein